MVKTILHYLKHKNGIYVLFHYKQKPPLIIKLPPCTYCITHFNKVNLHAIKCKSVALNYLNHLVLFQISLEMHSLFRLIHMVPNLNQGLKKQSWRLA